MKWGKEIDYEGWHNSHQVRVWVESWTTVVSAAPVVLADLSFRLNVGAATRLDGREKNSTVCIRFLHLRGQKPIQVKIATLELQKGCFQLALEVQKICWTEDRKIENSDLEIAFFTSTGGRMEGRILLRSRASTSQEMEEDTLVGILMAFMLGNSVPRVPGVDLRWCPLTYRIEITSCALIGVTVRHSLFNLRRREVRVGHQRRNQVEWSINNRKDPTLRRMVKVLTKSTSGNDLLSFLKDRNWGTPGDRRRSPRWDHLRLHQHEHARGSERSEIAGQSQKGGEDPLDREETEQVIDKAGVRLEMQVHDTPKEGLETVMLGEGDEEVGTEMTNTSPPSQESDCPIVDTPRGWVDSDWAGDTDTRRSHAAYIIMMNDVPISWKSRRQDSVSLSTTSLRLRLNTWLRARLSRKFSTFALFFTMWVTHKLRRLMSMRIIWCVSPCLPILFAGNLLAIGATIWYSGSSQGVTQASYTWMRPIVAASLFYRIPNLSLGNFPGFLDPICLFAPILDVSPAKGPQAPFRHIDIRVHFCHELYAAGVMRLVPLRTHVMVANALTKSLPGPVRTQHREGLTELIDRRSMGTLHQTRCAEQAFA